MKPTPLPCIVTAIVLFCGQGTAVAHDPIFGLGPHVLFKQGVEIHLGRQDKQAGGRQQTELGLKLTYGLSGDWAAGVELPYQRLKDAQQRVSGRGSTRWFSKYRYWRKDRLGIQESAAVLLSVKPDRSNRSALGSRGNNALLGLSYGYESLIWYRWGSIRHQHHGKDDNGLRRGEQWRLDLALGVRLKPPLYRKPDTVWIIELNGEHGQAAQRNNTTQANTGGTEWFISPGIFWTQRNFAIKAGVQLAIASALNGDQERSDYRAKLELEWHL